MKHRWYSPLMLLMVLGMMLAVSACGLNAGQAIQGRYNLVSWVEGDQEFGSDGEWVRFDSNSQATLFIFDETYQCKYSFDDSTFNNFEIWNDDISFSGSLHDPILTLFDEYASDEGETISCTYTFALEGSSEESSLRAEAKETMDQQWEDATQTYNLVSDIIKTEDGEETELGYDSGEQLVLTPDGIARFYFDDEDDDLSASVFDYQLEGSTLTLTSGSTKLIGNIVEDDIINLTYTGEDEEFGAYTGTSVYALEGSTEETALKAETDERLYLQQFVEQPEPANGTILYNAVGSGASALKIVPISSSDSSYYFKVTNNATGELAMAFYSQGGQAVRVSIPAGAYTIAYASGDTWYGEENLFGPDTYYAKFDDIFDIPANMIQTIEMTPQFNGNLGSVSLDPDEF